MLEHNHDKHQHVTRNRWIVALLAIIALVVLCIISVTHPEVFAAK